jgi:hypothetical protein
VDWDKGCADESCPVHHIHGSHKFIGRLPIFRNILREFALLKMPEQTTLPGNIFENHKTQDFNQRNS